MIPEKGLLKGLVDKPKYDQQDIKLTETLKATYNQEGWAIASRKIVVVPYNLLYSTVKQEHNTVLWRTDDLLKHLQKSILGRNMVELIQSRTERCEICCKNNPKTQNKIQFSKILEGQAPGEL